MTSTTITTLRLPALEVTQGERRIYCFAVDGKQLRRFASVSRAHRDGDALLGYQRPEVLAHVKGIRRYLESPDALMPNAVVLAFDRTVVFEPTAAPSGPVPYSVPGELVIPVDTARRAALIVDGQQRSAALRDADLSEFPVAVVGFIPRSPDEERSQFILVNSTKPLPPGLIHELLPGTEGPLPARFVRKRLPAELMDHLNRDPRSPLCGRIATPTNPHGVIKDNSVLRMLENSLYEGALYQYRLPDGTGDVDAMLAHLTVFWTEVAEMWRDAWNLPPRKSRLTHGVGVVALGYVRDETTECRRWDTLSTCDIRADLAALGTIAAWTGGTWHLAPGDERPWNQLQNTSTDIRLLTAAFRRCVKASSGSR